MLTAEKIIGLFHQLNEGLRQQGEIGEIGIIGGTVMCLVYNCRSATKDVDAIFEPAAIIRKLSAQIAKEHKLPSDWLNDAAKGFLVPGFQKTDVVGLSNLRVWAPDPRYMLAMKCISARWDTSDRDDVQFLIRHLQLRHAAAVFAVIEAYYPRNVIPAKTQFFLEEICSAQD